MHSNQKRMPGRSRRNVLLRDMGTSSSYTTSTCLNTRKRYSEHKYHSVVEAYGSQQEELEMVTKRAQRYKVIREAFLRRVDKNRAEDIGRELLQKFPKRPVPPPALISRHFTRRARMNAQSTRKKGEKPAAAATQSETSCLLQKLKQCLQAKPAAFAGEPVSNGEFRATLATLGFRATSEQMDDLPVSTLPRTKTSQHA